MDDPGSVLPLVRRAPEEVVFALGRQSVTAAMFLEAAQHVANDLPDAQFVVNLCNNRMWFTVVLAAAILRGQTTLLVSDRSSDQLSLLADEFPGIYVVADSDAAPHKLYNYQLQPFKLFPVKRDVPNPAILASQVAAIVFTSGTTGRPLGHRKLWGALTERSVDAAEWMEFNPSRTAHVVGMVPPYHMYGLETTVLLPLHTPAATWCGAAFYPQDVAAALRAIPEPRILVTTPLQIRTLLHASVDFPPLDRIISATAPLFPEIATAAEQRWNAPVFEIFGATEVGSIASRRTIAGDIWTTYSHVQLSQTEDNHQSETVVVSSPTAEPYPLSDVLDLLDDRHFRLVGRRTDVVKLGGRRASLAELNRILAGIDGVIDGQFVAPDDLDQQPAARLLVFAVAPERSAEDLLAELRNRIDPLFLPRRVVMVDSLPRNDVGKLTGQALGELRARTGKA